MNNTYEITRPNTSTIIKVLNGITVIEMYVFNNAKDVQVGANCLVIDGLENSSGSLKIPFLFVVDNLGATNAIELLEKYEELGYFTDGSIDGDGSSLDVNILSPNPLPVIVTNQVSLTSMETTLSNILVSVQQIDANTDTVETVLGNILVALGTLDSDDDGTALATIISNLGSVVIELQGIDANTDTLEASLGNILAQVTPNATEIKQDDIIVLLEDGLFNEIPAWKTNISQAILGIYPFNSNNGVEFDDVGLSPISSFGPNPTLLNNPQDLVDYLSANTTDFNFSLGAGDILIVTSRDIDVAPLYRIDFLSGPQIGFTTTTTTLISTQSEIIDLLANIEPTLKGIETSLAQMEGQERLEGAFLSTDNTDTTAIDKIGTEIANSGVYEYTLIFHGTGGSFSGIPAFDGRTYTFKADSSNSLIGTGPIVVPTGVSPVTALQGVEILFIVKQ